MIKQQIDWVHQYKEMVFIRILDTKVTATFVRLRLKDERYGIVFDTFKDIDDYFSFNKLKLIHILIFLVNRWFDFIHQLFFNLPGRPRFQGQFNFDFRFICSITSEVIKRF